MRVALNVEQLLDDAPGGIGRYTAELARGLPAAGVDVVPFVARHAPAVVEAAMGRFGLDGVVPVRLLLPRPLLYDAWHVLGAFGPNGRTGAVDVVHAPSLAVPPTGRVPLVVTAHDAVPVTMPETLTRRGRWFHRRGLSVAARRARLVVTVSEFAAGELSDHTAIRRDRIRVVHNGVDRHAVTSDVVAATRIALGVGARPYVLWLGVMQPRKNVALLVEAFARLLATADLPHELVIAGAGGWLAGDDAERAARRLGGRVRRIGAVPADQVAPLLAGADVFAFPSRHEGFGLPVLEAMAQGTAVVCSDIPALREVAGEAARLVPPDDVEAWVDALGMVLADPAERARLGAAGALRAGAFSWDQCVAETVAVYRECASSS